MMFENHYGRIARATFVAGPMFLLTATLADLYLRLPGPIIIDAASLIWFVQVMIGMAFFGAIVAGLINIVGSIVMLCLAQWFAPARLRLVWAFVGSALGASVAWMLYGEPQIAFPLTVSSALCAWLCHAGAPMDETLAAA